MALIKCPNCGLDVSEKATTCIYFNFLSFNSHLYYL